MKSFYLNTSIVLGYSPGILIDSPQDVVFVEDHVYHILCDKHVSLTRKNRPVILKSEDDLSNETEHNQIFYRAGKNTLKIIISVSDDGEELLSLIRLYDIADITTQI